MGVKKPKGVDLMELAMLVSNPDLKADRALHNVRVGASEQQPLGRFRPLPCFLGVCYSYAIPCAWSVRALSFGPPSIRAKEKLIALVSRMVSRIGGPHRVDVRTAKKDAQPADTEVYHEISQRSRAAAWVSCLTRQIA